MVYLADKLNESEINPITNLPYDDTWVAYCLTDADDYKMMVGNSGSAVYTARVSRKYSGWKMSVCDFIYFHESVIKISFCQLPPKIWRRRTNAIKGTIWGTLHKEGAPRTFSRFFFGLWDHNPMLVILVDINPF